MRRGMVRTLFCRSCSLRWRPGRTAAMGLSLRKRAAVHHDAPALGLRPAQLRNRRTSPRPRPTPDYRAVYEHRAHDGTKARFTSGA